MRTEAKAALLALILTGCGSAQIMPGSNSEGAMPLSFPSTTPLTPDSATATATPVFCPKELALGGAVANYKEFRWNLYPAAVMGVGEVETLVNGTKVCLLGFTPNRNGAWIFIGWEEEGKARTGWVGSDSFVEENNPHPDDWWERAGLPEIAVDNRGNAIGTLTPTPIQ